MAAPDFRINFPSARIDFATDVGVTNTDMDDYPPPQGQARYDHMRMVLLGLLSQQASYSEPTVYNDGTTWFDLNSNTLKIRRNDAWVLFSEAVPLVEDDDGNVTSLADWFASVSASLGGLAPEIIFNGQSTADAIQTITIPTSLRAYLYSDSRAFVYKNGLLIDPRNVSLESGTAPTTVVLLIDQLDTGDTFTVIIRRVPDTTFYTPSVLTP